MLFIGRNLLFLFFKFPSLSFMERGNIIRVHDPNYYTRKIWIGICILTILMAIKWIAIRIQDNRLENSSATTTMNNQVICSDSALIYKNNSIQGVDVDGVGVGAGAGDSLQNISLLVQQDEWITLRGCYSPLNPTRVYFQVDLLDYSMDETFTIPSTFPACKTSKLKYPTWILAHYSFYQETGGDNNNNNNSSVNQTRVKSNSLVFSAPLLQDFTSYLEEEEQIVFMVNAFEKLNHLDPCQRAE